MTENVQNKLADALKQAQTVTVLTGAGISAGSGLATFRDAQTGLWAHFRPEDLATPEAFARDPELVWRWYAWRRTLADTAAPNPAHTALMELAKRVPRFTLITQNVDSLHQRAGSVNVIELHGSLRRARCEVEGTTQDWEPSQIPPRCVSCGQMLRPDIVWFGESLPEAALHAAMKAATDCDLFLSIGTSGIVHPAASLIGRAAQNGATIATINLEVKDYSSMGRYQIQGNAEEVLPQLLV